ncbi:MAG: hypothetical protein V2G41_09995 [bacterium JZ-2024 1]
MQAIFAIAAVVRPEVLRPAWNITDDEAKMLAEPAARIIDRANPRVAKAIRAFVDPISLIVASYVIYNNCKVREKEIIASHQGEASAAQRADRNGVVENARGESESASDAQYRVEYYTKFTPQ